VAREREAKQRRRYQGLSAGLLRDCALRHCEDGDVGRGLLWLAQSPQMVPDDDPDLQRAIRTNLAGWQEQVHPLLGLLGHEAQVVMAGWSPDGRLILTAGGDRTTRLWDAATGHAIGRPLLHRGPVRALAFGPRPRDSLADGGRWTLVTGSEDKTARIREVPAPLSGSPDRIMLSLQAANGLILDAQGVVDFLPPATWGWLRQEPVALGGPR